MTAARLGALRDQAGWRLRIDGAARVFPCGAAAQQQAEAIVLEVGEPEAEPFDVFDDQVGAFDSGVGEPVVCQRSSGVSQRRMVLASRVSSWTSTSLQSS